MDACDTLEEALSSESLNPAPENAYLVLCDVVDSTSAIESGKYKDINALAVAFITGLRNAFAQSDLPFVFGGDGAVCLLVEPDLSLLQQVLENLSSLARDGFDLNLRTGFAPVAWLEANSGRKLMISRYRESTHVAPYLFCGGVSEYADKLLKQDVLTQFMTEKTGEKTDVSKNAFDGFECRWEAIQTKLDSVGAFIFKSRAESVDEVLSEYRKVLRLAESIYGPFRSAAHPVDPDFLKLTVKSALLRVEETIRSHELRRIGRWVYRVSLRAQCILGEFFMRKGLRVGGINWGDYRPDLVANADIRKVDDTLRFIIAGTQSMHEEFEQRLANEFSNGFLLWGSSHSKRALITCMIGTYQGTHYHFVDGELGGYARAATELKRKLRQVSGSPTDVT